MVELTLVIELALNQAHRLKINKVRIPLIEKWDAEFLVAILKAEISRGC
jgi:hypothetical protein